MTLAFRFSPILLLFFPGRPSAIFSAVWTIIVNAIKTKVTRWPRPHVAIEHFKGFNPFLANGDAAPAVAWISMVIRIEAAFFHSYPNIIFGGTKHAMLGTALLGHFFGSAFAAGSVPACQQVATDIHDIPAIAQARPTSHLSDVMLRAVYFAKNDKPAKTLADQILSGVRVLRGRIEGHREPPVLGVKSRDVDASPAQSIGDFASPLYHFGAQIAILEGNPT